MGSLWGRQKETRQLIAQYIETGDSDDLNKLESKLSDYQKESFMGKRVRKDGSLRG